jgi:hypothetical protein
MNYEEFAENRMMGSCIKCNPYQILLRGSKQESKWMGNVARMGRAWIGNLKKRNGMEPT